MFDDRLVHWYTIRLETPLGITVERQHGWSTSTYRCPHFEPLLAGLRVLINIGLKSPPPTCLLLAYRRSIVLFYPLMQHRIE